MYHLYVLQSALNGRFYVGHTADLIERVEHHNQGRTRSTKPYRPWTLVYSEQFDTKSKAQTREYQIKRMKSRKYIQMLIDKQ